MSYDKVVTRQRIDRAMKALESNGIKAIFVETGQEAREKVVAIIPGGAELMNMTSVTLEQIGLEQEIKDSGRYDLLRAKFAGKSESEKRKLGGGPDWAIGSVHALTEDGKLLIASQTGSQLGAYAYGAQHVIWVVGAHKIVKDVDEGLKRIYEYSLPLESERANKAYHITTGSNVSKLLIINKEFAKDRATVVIVNEPLGF